MCKVRVHELAKELGITSKRVMEVLEVLGAPAKSHSSTLTGEEAERVRSKLRDTRPGSGLITAPTRPGARSVRLGASRGRLSDAVRERTKALEEATPRPESGRATLRRAVEAEAPTLTVPGRLVRPAPVEKAAHEEEERPAEVVGADEVRAAQPEAPAREPELPTQVRREPPRREVAATTASSDVEGDLAVEVDFEMERPEVDEEDESLIGFPIVPELVAEAPPPITAPREVLATRRTPVRERDRVRRDRKDERVEREERALRDLRPTPGIRRDRGRRPAAAVSPEVEVGATIKITDPVSVRGLADALQLATSDILRELLARGAPSNINASISGLVAKAIAADLGIEVDIVSEQQAASAVTTRVPSVKRKRVRPADVDERRLVARPPAVSVLGHVDHGKTKLLDCIRNTNVVAGEAGGITQHIGASEVEHDGRTIVFLDTPGHEAFSAMRARGAEVTDVAVLVVAANDGVMPQTVEALNHIRSAGIPLVVAINKIDLPDANPDRVMQQLTHHGLMPEEWGGETVCVRVSALEGSNIGELLDMILLVADMEDLRAEVGVPARATVIEAKRDSSKGPVATVIVQAGVLREGECVVCGRCAGRVRALIGPSGRRMKEVMPGYACEVWGLEEVPEAGDELRVVDSAKTAHQMAKEAVEAGRARASASTTPSTLLGLLEQVQAGDISDLKLIVKADVHGSLEAITQALERLEHREVRVTVAHSGVGSISESDVNLAATAGAVIMGFNVGTEPGVDSLARDEGVEIRLYSVIYEIIDDVRDLMVGKLKPRFQEVVLGHAQVRALFKISHTGVVAGCLVTDGSVKRGEQMRVLRNKTVVHEGRLDSLRHVKDDVSEIEAGRECGISLNHWNGFQEGDVIECYTMEELRRTLSD